MAKIQYDNGKVIVWGQLGIILYLTDSEMDDLLTEGVESTDFLLHAINEKRFSIADQFYSPGFENDDAGELFVRVHGPKIIQPIYGDDDYHRTIWCRLGINFIVNKKDIETLKKQNDNSEKLILSLIERNAYEVFGSSLFESENDADVSDIPKESFYIDVLPKSD